MKARTLAAAALLMMLAPGIATAETRTVVMKDSVDTSPFSHFFDQNNTFIASSDAAYAFVPDGTSVTLDGGGNLTSVNYLSIELILSKQPYKPLVDYDSAKADFTVTSADGTAHTLSELVVISTHTVTLNFGFTHLTDFDSYYEVTWDGSLVCHEVAPSIDNSASSYTFELKWGKPDNANKSQYLFIPRPLGAFGFTYPECVNQATGNNSIPLTGPLGSISLTEDTFGTFPHDDTVIGIAQSNQTATMVAQACGAACGGAFQSDAAACSALDLPLPGWLTSLISAVSFGHGVRDICVGGMFSFVFSGITSLTQSMLTGLLGLIPGGGFFYYVITAPFQILVGILQIFADIFLYSQVPYGVAGLYFAHVVLFLMYGLILFGFTGDFTYAWKPAGWFIRITWTGVVWLAVWFFTKALPTLIEAGIALFNSIANFFSNMIP